MGVKTKSKIKSLPPEIINVVNSLIQQNKSIDDITNKLKELLGTQAPSRTAVGNYSKEIKDIAKEINMAREIASGVASELGDKGDSELHRLLIEQLSTITYKILQNSPELDKGMLGMNLKGVASAIKTLIDAKQSDIKYRDSIKQEIKANIEKAISKEKNNEKLLARIRAELE